MDNKHTGKRSHRCPRGRENVSGIFFNATRLRVMVR